MNLIEQLIHDEGMRLKPYRDTVGKLTIGVGRNLDDVGISKAEATALLANDIAAARQSLRDSFSWFDGLDQARQDALTNMCFNMGITRLKGFKRFLTAMSVPDYPAATREMLSSLWATQVGARALRLAEQIKTGVVQ